MPGTAAVDPGLTTFFEHGGLVHSAVLASLLGDAFASGKSFEYSLGPPEDMVQRVQLLVPQHLLSAIFAAPSPLSLLLPLRYLCCSLSALSDSPSPLSLLLPLSSLCCSLSAISAAPFALSAISAVPSALSAIPGAICCSLCSLRYLCCSLRYLCCSLSAPSAAPSALSAISATPSAVPSAPCCVLSRLAQTLRHRNGSTSGSFHCGICTIPLSSGWHRMKTRLL